LFAFLATKVVTVRTWFKISLISCYFIPLGSKYSP
jgi:hypothetical protein